ncbi:uncharacterized protein [Typha latifolia]|uniref:uncharacterized protein isoform X2 n=2 Tax=Typha latifolia TaxID=4733 RepID=UPI003C30B760
MLGRPTRLKFALRRTVFETKALYMIQFLPEKVEVNKYMMEPERLMTMSSLFRPDRMLSLREYPQSDRHLRTYTGVYLADLWRHLLRMLMWRILMILGMTCILLLRHCYQSQLLLLPTWNPILRTQLLLIQEIVGENCNSACDFQEDKEYKMKSKNEYYPKLDEGITKCSLVTPHMDLPTELRCFLCNTIFKDAVMIPCCQHSFCDKCIRSALIELGRCPKCSSSKCTVKDLLPNLSLRQAIEHFLEAHAAIDGSHIFMPPDGESGIQAKEASCAISIRQQKEPEVPDSPSATGKGSNQVMSEYAFENRRAGGICIRLDSDKSVKMASSFPKIKQTNLMTRHRENSSAAAFNDTDDIQGGGSSSILHRNLPTKEEAYFPIQKKKGLNSNTQDGTGGFMVAMKNRKGDRNCYMCGSPNHLIRDCPLSANTYSGDVAFPGGISAYGPPYWHGSTFSHIRPYADMFGTPGLVPFDPRIVPVTPFAVPSYGPSLYPGVTTPYGFMRMGGLSSPVLAAAQGPLSHGGFMDLQGGRQKYVERELDYNNNSEDYHYDETRRRSHERKHQSDKETLRSCSDDGNQMIHKKHQQGKYHTWTDRERSYRSDEEIHCSVDWKQEKGLYPSVSGRDDRSHCSEKSTSEVHDASDSSNQHSRQRSKHYHHCGSVKQNVSRGKCESNSGRKNLNRNLKERTDDMEIVKDHKRHRHKHHNHLESRLEPESDFRHISKEKESSQSSRHSKTKASLTNDRLKSDRWEMVDGPDDYYGGEYYHHKRKGTH